MQQRRAETQADVSSGAGPETLAPGKTLPGRHGRACARRQEKSHPSSRRSNPGGSLLEFTAEVYGIGTVQPFPYTMGLLGALPGQGQPVSVEPGRQSEQLIVLLSLLVLIPASS
jgi:hypothetical protein